MTVEEQTTATIIADLQARSLAYSLLRKYPLAQQEGEAGEAAVRWAQLCELPAAVGFAAVAAWQELVSAP